MIIVRKVIFYALKINGLKVSYFCYTGIVVFSNYFLFPIECIGSLIFFYTAVFFIKQFPHSRKGGFFVKCQLDSKSRIARVPINLNRYRLSIFLQN